MERQEALKLIKRSKNKNLVKHMWLQKTVMAKLAEHFGEDKSKWALTGLLHDVDYDKTKDDLMHIV